MTIDDITPDDSPDASARLRQTAERQLEEEAAVPPVPNSKWGESLLHELQVHQIELELQNEELQRSHRDLAAARDRYASLYHLAPVGFLTLSAAGIIIEVNAVGSGLLGVHHGLLVTWNFSSLVAPGSLPRWREQLARVLAEPDRQSGELNLRRPDGSVFPAYVDMVRRTLPGEEAFPHTILLAVVPLNELTRGLRERAEHAERLNQMSKRMAGIQEDERKALSAEIHDRSSPNLAAIKLNLATLKGLLPEAVAPELAALIDDIGALVDDTAHSLREVCGELRPPLLDYAGLLPAVESCCRQFGRRSGIAVTVDGANFRRRPPAEHETAIFRILCEALTNCAKHSRADAIHVALANEGDRVLLSVVDNGIGFDTRLTPLADQMSCFGLVSMRERAELAGGEFELDTGPGRGVRIKVRI